MAFPVVDFFSKNVYTENFKAFEAVYGMKKKPEEKDGKVAMADNLFLDMRGYLIFGRVIGVIPLSGVFGLSHKSLRFKMLSVPVIVSLCITLIVSLSTVMSLLHSIKSSKSNALEIARSVQGFSFILWGFFCYIYFLLRAESIINIFKTWEKSTLYHSVKDKTFPRDIILISTIVFVSATLETTVNHMEYFPQFDGINGMSVKNASKYGSALEAYYWRSNGHWGRHFGYHPLLAVLSFVSHKFVLFCWNYVDVLMIIFARALYFKFKGLCQIAVENLKSSKESLKIRPMGIADQLTWVQIVKDHDTLCNILEAFEKFLSPLIFGSYTTNIYYICMQLIDGLTPDKIAHSVVHSIFTPWSFLHLTMRIFLLSVTAARINLYAHEIGNILKKCPIEFYDAEVARVDKHVTAGPDIGLSGLGCFIVTKPFILSIVNVIFTVEIVLLQGLSSATGPCTASTKS
ncbi:unnamed protein product [Orchesella dallaii]|uniref:Gustatory receptor n=1 Tax=Orchesella dallaii TaxID=48710 RepID=A0ABP1QB84_9HEXA